MTLCMLKALAQATASTPAFVRMHCPIIVMPSRMAVFLPKLLFRFFTSMRMVRDNSALAPFLV